MINVLRQPSQEMRNQQDPSGDAAIDGFPSHALTAAPHKQRLVRDGPDLQFRRKTGKRLGGNGFLGFSR